MFWGTQEYFPFICYVFFLLWFTGAWKTKGRKEIGGYTTEGMEQAKRRSRVGWFEGFCFLFSWNCRLNFILIYIYI